MLGASGHTDDLRLVTLCYRYAYLRERRAAGLSRAERIVWGVLERSLEGDPEGQRRGHRRMTVLVPAQVRAAGADVAGTLGDISGAGMYLQGVDDLALGQTVQVRLGQDTGTEYRFDAQVIRRGGDQGATGYGLRFVGVPLELRRGADHPAA